MINGFKGFDEDLKCRGFQYEIGKEYETDKKPIRCTKDGFHLCEYPFDVFGYYFPATSRYCKVDGDGEEDRNEPDDSKVAVSKIRIRVEIGLRGIIEGAIKFIFDKTNWTKENSTTGDRAGAQATGDQAGAQATGIWAVATAVGNEGKAEIYGDGRGSEGCAIAIGRDGKAKGNVGCWLILAEWDTENNEYHRKDIQCIRVDGIKIKADTFYCLKNGEFKETNTLD